MSKKFSQAAVVEKVQDIPNPVNVTSEKFNDWVYRLWVTSPTNYPVNEFYNRFRESLWDLYTAQKPSDQEG